MPIIELQGPDGEGIRMALSANGRTLAAGRDKIAVWIRLPNRDAGE